MAKYITTVLNVFYPRGLDKLSYDQTLESFILTVKYISTRFAK
jgi:hypothetical protein